MNNHINRRRFSASMALTAVATAALLTGCGKVPDTIKIGVAQPLSGPLGALGQDLLNGVKLAVDELNKSGYTVDGKRVTLEVVSVDDKADASNGDRERYDPALAIDRDIMVYRISGAFFFGAVAAVASVLDRLSGYKALVIDFKAVPLLDSTVTRALRPCASTVKE